ncbi:hypothetical protein E5P38_20945 [Escherichia coli]|nr:hypothetical protein APX99_20145 [Escherichia coli]TGI59812.1 hypothetical protein E5P37_21170 [Escherichia coli]TGI76251.1 hypothetical protein E5P38_20945 [Escherichia coli]
MFAGKKSAQIREILISESAWEEMTCLFAPSLAHLSSFCELHDSPKQDEKVFKKGGGRMSRTNYSEPESNRAASCCPCAYF